MRPKSSRIHYPKLILILKTTPLNPLSPRRRPTPPYHPNKRPQSYTPHYPKQQIIPLIFTLLHQLLSYTCGHGVVATFLGRASAGRTAQDRGAEEELVECEVLEEVSGGEKGVREDVGAGGVSS